MTFDHDSRAGAPRIVLLHTPHKLPCTRFQLSFTAPRLPYLLDDLPEIDRIVRHFERCCGEGLIVSACELTMDFPVAMLLALRTSIYAPRRVPKRFSVQPQEQRYPTIYLGSRRSAAGVKLYDKDEAGYRVARVELTLRRDALRGLGITSVFALANVDWSGEFTKRVRFVEFVPSSGADPLQAQIAGRLARGELVNEIIGDLEQPCERRWFQRHLRETATTVAVRDALRAFQDRLGRDHSETCECERCTPADAVDSIPW